MPESVVQDDSAAAPAALRVVSDTLIGSRATAADDSALQQLHAEIAIPGHIGLRFSRKPSFFAGPESLGAFDALVVNESSSAQSRLVGMLSRSVRPTYIEGKITQTAFINHLRVLPGSRSIAVLRRLCAELYELQREQPAELTLATISSGNNTALGILVDRPLKCFPKLLPLDDIITFSIPARTPKASVDNGRFMRGTFDTTLPSARGKNFFPAVERWSEAKLSSNGLAPEHMLTALKHGETFFHGALWDQSASKQVEVTHLSPLLAFAKPFYNAVAALRGRSGIPAPGRSLRALTLSFLGVKENSAAIFRSVLPELTYESHRRGSDQFVVTLSARDPLVGAARQFAAMSYRSTVYAVSFDHTTVKESLRRRLCYLDPGFL